MDPLEIENLIVRLSGEGSDYESMLNHAEEHTQSTAKDVEQAAEKIEGFGNRLTSFAHAAVGALALIGVGSGLKEAFAAYTESESVDIRLRATLRAQGRDVEALSKDYQDWATEIEHISTMSDEAAKLIVRQAESFDLTGAAAKKAAEDAIGLGKANDMAAESMIRLTAAVNKGDIATAMMFARMVPQLRRVKDEEQFLTTYHKLVAAGFEAMTEEANTASGQLKQLSEIFGDLMEDFGGIIAVAIKPFVAGLREVVDWFQGLDKVWKGVIVTAVAFLTALIALPPVLTVLGAVLAPLGAALTAAFGPVGLLVTAAGVAIAVFVDELGGMAATWDYLKKKAEEAWDYTKEKFDQFVKWATPIWEAMKFLGTYVWDRIKAAAVTAWEFVKTEAGVVWDYLKGLWADITKDSDLTWDDVQKAAVIAISSVEWALKNLDNIAEYAWTGMKLKAYEFRDDVVYLFTKALPAPLQWFSDNWQSIFKAIVMWTGAAFTNMASDIEHILMNTLLNTDWSKMWAGFKEALKMTAIGTAAVITGLPGLIAGTVKFSDLWADEAKKGAENILDKLKGLPDEIAAAPPIKPFVLPEREVSEAVRVLREQYKHMGEQLGESYDEFINRRLEEIYGKGKIPPEILDELEKPGESAAKGFDDAKKSFEKFDAALRGSAETVHRLQEYADMLSGEGPGLGAKGGGKGGGKGGRGGPARGTSPSDVLDAIGGGEMVAVNVNAAGGGNGADESVSVLKDIRNLLKDQNDKPGIDVEAAGLVA